MVSLKTSYHILVSQQYTLYYSGEYPALLQNLLLIQGALADLLQCLDAGSSSGAEGARGVGVVVYDRLIVAREHVRAAVAHYFRTFVRSVTVFEMAIESPSVALSKITACAGVLQVRHRQLHS
jgi:hypothetical protein